MSSLLVIALAGCGPTGGRPVAPAPKADDASMPKWVRSMKGDDTHLCGLGISGAGFENSPYPKINARERAVQNLAGIIGTHVEEAMIDDATMAGDDVQYARVVHVDDELVAQVDGAAEIEYWTDDEGKGPYREKGFVYGWACIPKEKAAETFQVSAKAFSSKKPQEPAVSSPDVVPKWIAKAGKRKDGRFCAVGYSQPTFQAEMTFANVVEDVRAQLATTVTSLVSNYFEELTTIDAQAIQSMTVSSNQAVSKGVVVTRFWYDAKGIGPQHRKRSTYGYGCAYPLEIVAASLDKAKTLTKQTVESVRQHAKQAFDALEAEEQKHGVATAK
ncbi:MAG: hypothetical protein ACAI38_21330 [Myxococcota bacterium]|nr:hypothetical protein [Myxococcota bacterium]